MSDDTDPVADESSLDEPAERDDLADAAEAADKADLLDPEKEEDEDDVAEARVERSGRFSWTRLLVAGLPVLALILALGVGYLKWLDGTSRESRAAAEQSIRAASDSTIAILSYKPETVDRDLKAAADRLAEPFRQQYTQLVNDVVAPGAKQQHITAVATVPAAASVSGDRKARGGTGFRRPDHHHRQRCADAEHVECARQSREGRRSMAHLAVRPSVSDGQVRQG